MDHTAPRIDTGTGSRLSEEWAGLPPLASELVLRWRRWASSPHGRLLTQAWIDRLPADSADRSAESWSAESWSAPRSGPATNRLQQVLVEAAQDGQVEAALTLVVQLRPGLVRLARSAAGWDWYRGVDAADETQATFFEVLYGLDLERRGRAVAANLVLDTRQRLWRRCPAASRHRDGHGDRPYDDNRVDPRPTSDSVAERVAIVVDVERGLNRLPGSASSRRLSTAIARRALFGDQPSRVIADELGLRPHTVDTRLYRIRAVLRESVRDTTDERRPDAQRSSMGRVT